MDKLRIELTSFSCHSRGTHSLSTTNTVALIWSSLYVLGLIDPCWNPQMIMFNLASTAPIGRGFSVNVLDHKMYGKGRSVDLTHNPAQRLCRHSSRLEGVLDCWLHSNGVLVSLEPGTLLLLGVEKVLQLAV